MNGIDSICLGLNHPPKHGANLRPEANPTGSLFKPQWLQTLRMASSWRRLHPLPYSRRFKFTGIIYDLMSNADALNQSAVCI